MLSCAWCYPIVPDYELNQKKEKNKATEERSRASIEDHGAVAREIEHNFPRCTTARKQTTSKNALANILEHSTHLTKLCQ